jgi:membrane protein DedA with SNARE-associated domain
MFLLGKHKGRALLDRFPKLAKKAERTEGLIRKYETPLILSFRFIYGMRNVTPIMLGINRVSHPKFLALNILTAGVWAAAFTWGGFFFGMLFEKYIRQASYALLAILAAAVIAGIAWYIRQHKRDKAARERDAPTSKEKAVQNSDAP